MRIVCQQTILMKYHALFVIFEEKNSKIWNCRLLQIKGGALRVNASLTGWWLFIVGESERNNKRGPTFYW